MLSCHDTGLPDVGPSTYTCIYAIITLNIYMFIFVPVMVFGWCGVLLVGYEVSAEFMIEWCGEQPTFLPCDGIVSSEQDGVVVWVL